MKTAAYSIFAMILLITASSCTKNSSDVASVAPPAEQSIAATVAAGQTFTYIAGNSGTLVVARQAAHFKLSETKTADGAAIYTYSPAADYFGNDEVALSYSTAGSIASSQNGCPGNHSESTSSTIVIKLTVTK